MASKLIVFDNKREILWREFAGLCKSKGIKVGEKTLDLIQNFIKFNQKDFGFEYLPEKVIEDRKSKSKKEIK